MKISIRVRLSMDERNAIHNMKKYQNFMVQTVESIIIKLQIKVVLFIINSLFYFHKFQPNSKRRS